MDSKKFVEEVGKEKDKLVVAAQADLEKATEAEREAILSKLNDKAKSIVKQREKDEALKLVLDLAKNIAGDDKAIMDAVALLTKAPRAAAIPGAPKAPSAPRVNRFMVLAEIFPAIGAQVHENDLFARYKLGRKDAYWLIADAIKEAKDLSARKWIAFDPESGMYTYLAQGENPPEGWTGYVPRAPKPAAPEAKTE